MNVVFRSSKFLSSRSLIVLMGCRQRPKDVVNKSKKNKVDLQNGMVVADNGDYHLIQSHHQTGHHVIHKRSIESIDHECQFGMHFMDCKERKILI